MKCTWRACTKAAAQVYVFGAIVGEDKKPIRANLCVAHGARYQTYVTSGQFAGHLEFLGAPVIRNHEYLDLAPTADMIVRQVERILSFGEVEDPGALAHDIEGHRVPWNLDNAVYFTLHGAVFRACWDFGVHLEGEVLARIIAKR